MRPAAGSERQPPRCGRTTRSSGRQRSGWPSSKLRWRRGALRRRPQTPTASACDRWYCRQWGSGGCGSAPCRR
jgi:hypothetical protein